MASEKDTFFSKNISLCLKGKVVNLSKPIVMGIINITPDSFYPGSRYNKEQEILDICQRMINEGADILDIGAISTRPGASDVSEKEEIERLSPSLRAIRKEFPHIILSLDTFRSHVAERMVGEFGIDIINDISAGTLDPSMFNVIAKLQLPYIIMHMQGIPKNMQDTPKYDDVAKDVLLFFSDKIKDLHSLGVSDIIIDPGFGFGKTIEHNYTLLKELHLFSILEKPLLVGLSRKSMIWKTINTSPENALAGTIAANTLALNGGATILRVHDVKAAVDAISVFVKMKA